MLRERAALADGFEVPRGLEERSRALAARGLVELKEWHRFTCVRFDDRDFERLSRRSCPGSVDVPPEWDDLVECCQCGRLMEPYLKEPTVIAVSRPNLDALTSLLLGELRDAGLTVREEPRGLLRASGRAGEVHVVFVDTCEDSGPFEPTYYRRDATVFVVADPCLAGRVPHGVRVFELLPLILDGALPLRVAVRKLARIDETVRPAAHLRRAAAKAPTSSPPPIVARLLTDRGVERVTQHAVDGLGDYDLVIDGCGATSTGAFRVRVRRDGQLTTETLTCAEALILIEIMERRTATPLAELPVVRAQKMSTPEKVFERARRKVDTAVGRYQWTLFHTRRSEPKAYAFDPPDGFRYAALTPVVTGTTRQTFVPQ